MSMAAAPLSHLLASAAALWGIESEYWDIFGARHEASDPLIRNILASLGVDSGTDEALEEAVRARRAAEEMDVLPPVLVLSESDLRIRVRAQSEGEVTLLITCEDGASHAQTLDLKDAPEENGRKVLALPALPPGYHQLEFRSAGASASCRLIVAPDQAYAPERARMGGIAVSLYGLRSERNWGCGDFTDLEDFIDWAAANGASFVSLNPLHAIANRAPYNTSPYLPNSSFFRNFIYLDVEQLPEFGGAPLARRILSSPQIQSEIAALRASENVEYERVARLKLRFLKVLFRAFLKGPAAARAEFDVYLDRQGTLLRRFALHSALDEAIHRANPEIWNWREWPEGYRNPDSPEVEAFARQHRHSVLFYAWIQWRIEQQLARVQRRALNAGMAVGLYHDLALAVDRFGADLWANPSFYVDGCRVGAPPDAFSPKGQDWAFPPPNSERHRADGYRMFAESVRRNMMHGGALRIDHVMRFFRLYWIPDGMSASEGTYVRDRYEDLVRILALESVRNRSVIVGEDLGTVPDIARGTLARFGILSYRLFYFEKDYQGNPPGRFRLPAEYPESALVSVSTHDLPTLAGFWLNRDIEARRAAGILPDESAYQAALAERLAEKQKMIDLLHGLNLLPAWFPRDAAGAREFTGDLHRAIVEFLSGTPSKLFVLNQEDIFKDTDQQNLPGTTAEYPNWRHKMKFALGELRSGYPAGCAAMFRDCLARSGRLA
ncbi:MAG TPA: 4-alpha-glucanotransferase [Bryobacteraceae bacterium]|nr:4-alpha-glucanotransferase [Bryobacteraceae bacterium]